MNRQATLKKEKMKHGAREAEGEKG